MKKLLSLLALAVAVSFITMGFITCNGNSSTPPPETHTVSFDANGGTGGQSADLTATVGKDMPELAGDIPTNSDYYFTGYWDAKTGGVMYYTHELKSARKWDKKEDTTLYAQWAVLTPAVSSTVGLVQSTTVAQAADFTYADILAMTREAIRLAGGLDGIVKAGDVVVLKPNVVGTFYNWAWTSSTYIPALVNGVTTDWRVIQAVAVIVREIVGPYDSSTGSGKIMLIEGAAGATSAAQFTAMGYTPENLTEVDEIIALDNEGTWVGAGVGTGAQAAYVTQVTLNDFVYKGADGARHNGNMSYATYDTYYKNDGKYWVNTKMLNADVLISIPVLKHHGTAAGVTGGIKNIGIGCPPPRVYGISDTNIGRNAMVNHSSMMLHYWIADYFACLPADFVVMDGLQGLTNGPGAPAQAQLAANQKNQRSILASKDALALDVVEANIMNWDYTAVRYLELLTTRGSVGPKPNGRTIPLRGNPKDIVVLGNVTVDQVRSDYDGPVGQGGRRLAAADLTKPTVTINSAAFSGDNLILNLTLSTGTDNNVVKVDIYIDDEYINSFNAGMARISVDTSGIASGSHSIQVRAFTKFMASAVAATTATK